MRVLKFDSDASVEHFKLIYEGLCMTQKQFTPKESRRLDKIFNAFEMVGKITEESKSTKIQLYEPVIPCEVHLEDADYDLVKSAIEPPNVQWNGMGSRRAGKALIFLDEAKSPDSKPELVKENK